jgi:inosine-uridine nucleoside N-ribohydrolase
MPIPVWIDTDPGIDDAVAIALAVRSPELAVAGLSTVYGNTSVGKATRNARHLLRRLGRDDLPVWAGAAAPLCRPARFAEETHGPEGFGYAAGLPPAAREAVEAPVRFLAHLRSAPEPVTVIALGPLTNLALALALDGPLCRRQVREIIWMGGSAGAPGNTTPVSEWNAWCDPEAARAVLLQTRPSPAAGAPTRDAGAPTRDAGAPTRNAGAAAPDAGISFRMVGLDVTRRMLLPAQAVARAGALGGEAPWWASLWQFYVEFHRQAEGLDGCIVNDPLAVALLLHPEWGDAAAMHVSVETAGDLTRGQTICDRWEMTRLPPNAAVYLAADGEAALRFSLERAMGGIDW